MEGITIYQVLASAVLVEAVWSTLSIIIMAITLKDNKTTMKSIGSMLIGVFIAVNYSIDLPGVIGLNDHFKLTGIVLTGVLISRGSTFIHDLLKTVENIRATTKDDVSKINKI
jgi:hypothetical protein